MKEIVRLRLEDTVEGSEELLGISQTTIVKEDLILMSNSLFSEDNVSIPLIENLSEGSPEFLREFSNVIEKAILLKPSEKSSLEVNLAYKILYENMKLLWVVSYYKFNKLVLIDEEGIEEEIEFKTYNFEREKSTEKQIYNVTIVVISDKELNNVNYIFHEVIDNPHRNLKESVLYQKEFNDYQDISTIYSNERDDAIKDKRSNVFIGQSLETL